MGRHLYFHLFENTIGPMPLPGIEKDQVESIRYLATGAEVPISTSWVHSDYPDIVFANLGPDPVSAGSGGYGAGCNTAGGRAVTRPPAGRQRGTLQEKRCVFPALNAWF